MDYVFDGLIILLIFIKLVLPRIKNKSNMQKILLTIFFIYLSIVYGLTLMPFRPIRNYYNSGFEFSFHFNAFADVVHSYGPAYREAFLNVLMLVPFGFILPWIKNKKVNAILIIINSFILSFGIEFLQLFDPSRSSDVTDLITNTLGGLLGYCLFKIMIHYRNMRKQVKS